MSSRRCAAKTCYNTQGCRPNLKFFNFPKDEETCMKWIINSEREDLLDKPVEQVAKFLLCADHFESHWFLNPKYKTIFIRTGNPVPTIFYNNLADFIPKGLQKNYERKKRNHTEQRNGFGSHVPESSEQPSTEELLEILGDGDTCNTSQTQPVDPDDYTVEINIDLDPCIDDSSANGAYHRMCRLCARLVYEFKLTSIFSSEDSQNLANKINRILPEKIYAGDGLPQHVCKTCIGILNECEAAVQAFIAADRKLRSLFNLQSVLLNQEQVEEMKSRNESPNSPLSTGENAGLPSGLEEFLTVRDDSQSKMAEDDPLETSQKSPVNVITTVCQKSEHDSFLRVYTYEKSGDQFSVVNESNNTSGNVTVKNSASEDISGNSEFDSENPENSDSSTVMELPVNPEAVVKIEQTWTENPEINTETCDSSQEAKCYYCSICGEMFNERNKLLIHEITEHIFEEKDEKESSSMQKKHKREQTTCSECGETFSGKKPLQRHIKQQHIPAENICEYCGAHYQSKSHLESHRVLHTKEKLFRCEVCEENFQFKKDLLLHKRSKHSRNKSLNCTVCSKTCPNRNALWRHEKTHTDERTVLCYLCGKVLSNPQSMRVHMRTHSADRPYSCPKCGKSFKDNASVSKHMLVHSADKNFSCEVCGRAFYSKALVKQHSLSHSGVKPHRCDVCGAAYNRLGNLNQHKKKHVENPQKVESFEHECIVCGKRMRSDLTLKYHLAKHTGEKKPFDCQICGKRFVAVDPYRVHMRIHTGERPYQCTTCGKTFRSSFTLKQHSGLHRDECPYACPYCERKFKRLQSLIVHKRTHTGEKPHRCPLCGRAFAQKGDMLKHTRTHNRYKSNVSASKMKEQAGVILEIEHIAGITELALSDSEITSEYLIDMPIVEVETEIPSEMQGNIPTEITSEVT